MAGTNGSVSLPSRYSQSLRGLAGAGGGGWLVSAGKEVVKDHNRQPRRRPVSSELLPSPCPAS